MGTMIEVDITFNLEYINFLEELGIPFREKKINYKIRDGNKHRLTYNGCLLEKDMVDNLIDSSENGIHKIEKVRDIDSPVYKVYSDGGSFNNGKKDSSLPTFGSFAYYCVDNHDEELLNDYHGYEGDTNNMGELKGCLFGVEKLTEYIYDNKMGDNEPINIVLISDSQYVIQGINTYIEGWIKRGWKNNAGKPTPNKGLWKNLYDNFLTNEEYNIYTKWVRGHTENDGNDYKYNDLCDYNCNLVINEWLETKGLPLRDI